MTKAELLAVLATDARGFNLAPPTNRAVEDWVTEGLMERATAHGRSRGFNPLWSYSENAVEAARCIIRLKGAGITRKTALRVHLWVRGHNIAAERVRAALSDEFHRFLQAERRRGEWKFDLSHHTKPTASEAARFDRQLGNLDPRIKKAGFRISRLQLLGTTSTLHWGNAKTASSPLSPVSGLFGNSDEIENAGEHQIALLTQENLENARSTFAELYVGAVQFQSCLFVSCTPFAVTLREAYGAVTHNWLQNEFLITTFTALAIAELSSPNDVA